MGGFLAPLTKRGFFTSTFFLLTMGLGCSMAYTDYLHVIWQPLSSAAALRMAGKVTTIIGGGTAHGRQGNHYHQRRHCARHARGKRVARGVLVF